MTAAHCGLWHLVLDISNMSEPPRLPNALMSGRSLRAAQGTAVRVLGASPPS